jgi:hypothetical protein
MIKKLQISNFKAFGEKVQTIPLKPITLILGPNSAGKSSVIHSLAFAHEAQRTGNFDVVHTEVGGNSIDLGGFHQFIHKGEVQREISLVFQISPEGYRHSVSDYLGGHIRITAWIGGTKGFRDVALNRFEVHTSHRHSSHSDHSFHFLLSVTKDVDGKLRIDSVNGEHPTLRDLARDEVKRWVADQGFGEDAVEDAEELAEELRLANHEVRRLENTRTGYEEERAKELGLAKLELERLAFEQGFKKAEGVDESDEESLFSNPRFSKMIETVFNKIQIDFEGLSPFRVSAELSKPWSIHPRPAEPSEAVTAAEKKKAAGWAESSPKDRYQHMRSLRSRVVNAYSEIVTESQQDLRKRRLLLMKDFTESDLRGNSVGLEKGMLRRLEFALMLIQQRLDEGINAFNYLGAIRHYPSRHVVLEDQSEDLPTALGEDAWKTLQTDHALRSKVNSWLSDKRMAMGYEFNLVTSYSQDAILKGVTAALKDCGEDLGVPAEQAIDAERVGYDANEVEWDEDDSTSYEIDEHGKRFEADPQMLGYPSGNWSEYLKEKIWAQRGEVVTKLVLRDLRTDTPVTPRDIGVGVSQLIPILVRALADVHRLIAIEEPESQLHPALGAALGDVFIESALGPNKNAFLLETHCENLILRVLRRIRQTTDGELPEHCVPITADDVAVLYVNPTSKGSEVIEIPVTEDGEFAKKFPRGFFSERLEELIR